MGLDFAPLKILEPKKTKNTKSTSKKNTKKNDGQSDSDILCELSHLRNGMKNYQAIIDSYLEDGVRPEKNNENNFRMQNPETGWNGNWVSNMNTKRKESQDIDTYNIGFSEMNMTKMNNDGPVSAVLDDEDFVNNLYDYNDLRENKKSSLFANDKPIDFNQQRMFFHYDDYDRYKYQNMSGSDMESHKQRLLNGKSLFLEDEEDLDNPYYNLTQDQNTDNDNDEDDKLSDIIGEKEDDLDLHENSWYAPNKSGHSTKANDGSYISSENEDIISEENNFNLERQQNYNNYLKESKQNSIKEIIIFIFSGIFIIFILEQIFRLGMIYSEK